MHVCSQCGCDVFTLTVRDGFKIPECMGCGSTKPPVRTGITRDVPDLWVDVERPKKQRREATTIDELTRRWKNEFDYYAGRGYCSATRRRYSESKRAERDVCESQETV